MMMGGVDGVGKGGDDSDITNDYDSDGDDGIMGWGWCNGDGGDVIIVVMTVVMATTIGWIGVVIALVTFAWLWL